MEEMVTILSRTRQVAKKQHICECGGIIPVGKRYLRTVGIGIDGKIVTDKFHDSSMECQDAYIGYDSSDVHPDFIVIRTSGTYGNAPGGKTDHYR